MEMTNIRHLFALIVISSCLWTSHLNGQTYRPLSGEYNNLDHPYWGQAYGPIKRTTPVAFADKISEPAAPERTNPRVISNMLFKQDDVTASVNDRSDYVWVFGQFINHDIAYIDVDHEDQMPIEIPNCDPDFDPECDGTLVMPMYRAVGRHGTGTSVDQPREYDNYVTSFIDASALYGVDCSRTCYLRTFKDGKLRLSQGDLLPFNTHDGEFNSGLDIFAPAMDMPAQIGNRWFVAGDRRVNENVLLTSLHTLFVREHNRWATELKHVNPSWTDEILFEEARLRTIATIQAITYYEWLPAIGIYLPEYTHYSPEMDPSTLKEFCAAACRFTQAMSNASIKRVMYSCEPHPQGDLSMQDAFFQTKSLLTDGGIDALLLGMSLQNSQNVDVHMVDDLRNIKIGDPGEETIMDLAAINIARGRDMGLPSFNEIRISLGLPPYRSFKELCENDAISDKLALVYTSIDDVDAWVGMLCESHFGTNQLFGRTMLEILKQQFNALRLGDRFYFENDSQLTDEEKAQIKSTRLSDVIKRNSDIKLIQDNVFYAEEDCDQHHITLEDRQLDAMVYPNPTVDGHTINLAVQTVDKTQMLLQLYDRYGRLIQINQYDLYQGLNIIPLSIDQLNRGQYFIRLESGAVRNNLSFIKP